MKDLIDRQAAIDAVLHHGEIENNYTDLYYDGYCDGVYDSADMLKDLPSAQPEPKTGRWEKMEARGRVYRCNQCGNFLDFDGVNVGRGDANYCPNCGAIMEGEEQ